MPGLAELLAEVSPRRGSCAIAAILEVLDKADRQTLVDALASPAVTHNALERALRSAGHPVGRSTIALHRKGECFCGRAS